MAFMECPDLAGLIEHNTVTHVSHRLIEIAVSRGQGDVRCPNILVACDEVAHTNSVARFTLMCQAWCTLYA
jgi:hypothetical protein